jgi:UDP-N-acetylmuramoyl-tripeptide--D-alanyl-D-alanine ligase
VRLWTANEIAEATGGTASAEFEASGVAFDSREVGLGDLFLALKGETTDGHRFLDQTFAQGAAGAIVSEATAHPHVTVADTAAALDALGMAARARMQGKVIGVTGSVGKTGTKEALFAALERNAPGEAHRSVKSYNNHTGVPLSLARMPRNARYGVFEMGMNHSGELAALTRLVRPHVAIVTTIAPAHMGFFADEEAIADAKGEIFQGLESGGTAIVPHDSRHRDRLIGAAKPYATKIVTFGLQEGADYRAVETMRTRTGGTFVTARFGQRELSFTLSQPGVHWVSNAMAILAAVDAVGGDLELAGLALAELGGIAGRGARLMVPAGSGEALVIDEATTPIPPRCARRSTCWRTRRAASWPCSARCVSSESIRPPSMPNCRARSKRQASITSFSSAKRCNRSRRRLRARSISSMCPTRRPRWAGSMTCSRRGTRFS